MSYTALGGHDARPHAVSRMFILCAGAAVIVLGTVFLTRSDASPLGILRADCPTASTQAADHQLTSNALATTIKDRLELSHKQYERARKRDVGFQARFGVDPPLFPKGLPLTVWDAIYPSFNSPLSVERVGAPGEGGKWVTGMERLEKQKKCVVYSFGVNQESSFEAEMLDRTNCEIFGYDFSVSQFGPEVATVPVWSDRAHFYPYMLGGTDEPNASPPKHTLQGLMKMNGHDFVDVVKMDIEEAEFSVLDSIIEQYQGRPLPFGQLQVEIHLFNNQSTLRMRNWFRSLEAAGLRPFWKEINTHWLSCCGHDTSLSEFSFMNIQGQHSIISDEAFMASI